MDHVYNSQVVYNSEFLLDNIVVQDAIKMFITEVVYSIVSFGPKKVGFNFKINKAF